MHGWCWCLRDRWPCRWCRAAAPASWRWRSSPWRSGWWPSPAASASRPTPPIRSRCQPTPRSRSRCRPTPPFPVSRRSSAFFDLFLPAALLQSRLIDDELSSRLICRSAVATQPYHAVRWSPVLAAMILAAPSTSSRGYTCI